MIRLAQPYTDQREADALRETLDSGMLVQGERVRAFEAAVARRLGDPPPEAVAVSNGTVALELALAALGVGPGDEVIVPAVSWPSPGHAVLLRGAVPVLVDIDPHTWNLDPARLPSLRTARTRAVIAIDQFGVPADIPAVRAACPGVAVLEDAACALGSSLHGVACGVLGDLGTFSFHPRKVITTGEGGMVTTRDAAFATRLRTLRNHGLRGPGDFVEAGSNARLSELQAAVGVAQCEKLDEILTRRVALAARMREAVDLRWQRAPAGAVVNHQTLGFTIPHSSPGDLAGLRARRDAVIAALRADGVEAGILSYALHRLPAFAAHAVNAARSFPVADAVVDGGIAAPLHPRMTEADADAVIAALRRHAGGAR